MPVTLGVKNGMEAEKTVETLLDHAVAFGHDNVWVAVTEVLTVKGADDVTDTFAPEG